VLEKIGQQGQDTVRALPDGLRVPVGTSSASARARAFLHSWATCQGADRDRHHRRRLDGEGDRGDDRLHDERSAFGRRSSTSRTPASRSRCKTEATVARIFLDECNPAHLRGELDNQTASMAKWWLTQKQCEIVDACLQLHGGYGYRPSTRSSRPSWTLASRRSTAGPTRI